MLPPADHPDKAKAKLWQVTKAMYGMRDAERVLQDYRNAKMSSLGWEKTPLPDVFLKRKHTRLTAAAVVYVDDIALAAFQRTAHEELREIRTQLDAEEPELLNT